MGCCSSRQTDPSPTTASPLAAPPTTQTTTSDPLNHRLAHLGLRSQPHAASRAQSSTAPTTASAGANRPNNPLRAPSPVPHCPSERALQPWTRARLDQERADFFDTRVTGDGGVWASIRAASEMLRCGDVGGAQALLDGTGVTCPTGRVKYERAGAGATGRGRGPKGGLYDERGQRYDVPGWVVRDPEDLVEDEGEKGALDGTDEEDEEEEDEVEGIKELQKGKGRARDVGPTVNVRARLSDRGTDVVVDVGMQQKVRVLVRKIQEKANTDRRVRLVYLGKVLSEEKSLAEQGWKDGHVVNALVFD